MMKISDILNINIRKHKNKNSHYRSGYLVPIIFMPFAFRFSPFLLGFPPSALSMAFFEQSWDA